ncbi:MAG: flagellin [Deltaproteobacteria bacterium]|jgi:flagellin|nr:flagellin [Deltaproteobacteria bacterium]MBT5486952.1 flagellin [Deltaproteobacteria bacterium]MBT5834119.1 flagellin [Deltaproteobacteria bacterium]MDG1861396.1 flagellin [SAR324 cluster bacterium]
MALRVNSNIAALNALRHLQHTEQELGKNLERLSSGRKLNHAADGPASLVISEQMKTQISGLGQAIRNSESSISMIQTTEGALNEVSNILINLRQLAVHAANEGTNDEKMLQADQNEVDNLLSTLKNISRNTQFGTRTLLDGSNSATGVVIGNGLEFVLASDEAKSTHSSGYKVDITQVATRSMMVAAHRLSLEDVSPSDPNNAISFVINEGGRTISVDLKNNNDLREKIESLTASAKRNGTPEARVRAERGIQQLIAYEMQKMADDANMDLDIFVYRPADNLGPFLQNFDTLNDALTEMSRTPGEINNFINGLDEVIVLRHRQFGSDPGFTVSSTLENYFGENIKSNEAVFSVPGRDVEGNIGGSPGINGGGAAMGRGQFLTGAPGAEGEGVTIKYGETTDDVIYEIFNRSENKAAGLFRRENNNETLVGDDVDGFVHVSQNSLVFQIGPNEGQLRRISVDSINPEELAKGIENNSNFQNLAEIDVLDAEAAQDTLLLVDQAIDDVSRMRGNLGSFQRNALEANLHSLRVSKENLTASESMLADTDMAQEMSSLVKNQILLSSGTAMLAQANQVPQSVLQLLNSNG